MSVSPYAPPQAAVIDPSATSSQAEAIRQEHIGHERQLKSIGFLYYFGGVMTLLAFIAFSIALFVPADGKVPSMLGIAALYLFLSVALLVLGYGFRGLKAWVTIPATILSAVGLLGFPVGTLINARILYLMYCKKGRVVLAPDYADIIAATPHVKYTLTVGDWIAMVFIGLLLVGLVLLFGSLVMRT